MCQSKKEPEKLTELEDAALTNTPDTSHFDLRYFLWKLLRQVSAGKQTVSSFSGWQLLIRKAADVVVQKTVMTYLPPINAPVTDFSTIFGCLSYMQKLCKDVNMPYVNVTLDLGAAMNAYKLVWNYPNLFSNIFIHVGDFHFMKESFSIIGMLIQGSGFEDIIFQSGMSSTGSLNGVLSGSHYNRCWRIHQHFIEALERLLFERFIRESDKSLADSLAQLDVDFKAATDGFIADVTEKEGFLTVQKEYLEYKEKIQSGDLGKTSQFWLVNYLDIMKTLHLIHSAVQENDFAQRLEGWSRMMPYFFSLNKTNYSRYGSYYIQKLRTLEKSHPGCKELISGKGLSVQAQDHYPLRTPIDQREEQTLNREAKTTGGISKFAGNGDSVTKWTLNRSSQAKITAELKAITGVSRTEDKYKALHAYQIEKSEKWTSKLVQTITQEFLNPFDDSLDQAKLYNLGSGIPVDTQKSEQMLKIKEDGSVMYEEFVEKRLLSEDLDFHDP